MLRIQKEFMQLEREKGVTERDIHHNPQGIVKEYSYNNSRQIMVSGVSDSGQFLISGVDPDDSLWIQNNDGQSAWNINLGFKYQF